MRLIDVDKLIEDIYSNAYACTNDEINKILHKQLETNINVINNQPTAYDVDKVVKQLEKQVYEIDDSLSLSARDVIDEEDVFEIVKAGGRDE